MAKEIQVTATLPALPEGYGPDVHWGPQQGRPHVYFHCNPGRWEKDDGESPAYLFHAYKRELVKPVKHVGYFNAYPSNTRSGFFETRAEADKFAEIRRIACVRVEYEEGQFDE